MSKRAYSLQKSSAKQRGIPFQLTYDEWSSVWAQSGYLSVRGRLSGQYVMARRGDTGPYAVWNVYITTGAQNTADAVANGRPVGKRVNQATSEELAANRLLPPIAVTTIQLGDAKSYRQAVRLAWSLRRVQKMTRQQLATEAELYPQHVTDYLSDDDKPSRRDLPADAVARFEAVVGNTLVSQWLASQSRLTVLEQMQADAKVAA